MAYQTNFYRIRVGTVVLVGTDTFYPNADYWVEPDFYDSGKTADGRDFKDVCLSAVQETQTYGA